MTNTPAVSVENCDDGWVTIHSEVRNGEYRPVLWEQISGRRRCSKQGSYTGQATVVGKMIFVSARDKMKRCGRCRDMHDVQCGDSPGYLGDKDPENGTSQGQCEETKQRALEENAVYEVKVTPSAFTSKDPQQGSQVSQERQHSVQSCSNQLLQEEAEKLGEQASATKAAHSLHSSSQLRRLLNEEEGEVAHHTQG